APGPAGGAVVPLGTTAGGVFTPAPGAPPGTPPGAPATPGAAPAAPARGGGGGGRGGNGVYVVSSGGMVHSLNAQTGLDLIAPVRVLPSANAKVAGTI